MLVCSSSRRRTGGCTGAARPGAVPLAAMANTVAQLRARGKVGGSDRGHAYCYSMAIFLRSTWALRRQTGLAESESNKVRAKHLSHAHVGVT